MTALPVKSLAGGALFDDILGLQDKRKDLIGDCALIYNAAKVVASGTPVEQSPGVDF